MPNLKEELIAVLADYEQRLMFQVDCHQNAFMGSMHRQATTRLAEARRFGRLVAGDN